MTDSSLDGVAQVAAAGAWRGSASASSRCVQNQLCVQGSHWDLERCRCVRG